MIFDCFPFNDEWEVLEIRLNELYDDVDCFVIAEGNLTHSGKPKETHLANLLSDKSPSFIDKFRHKIINYVVDLTPYNKPWERENAQRNGLMKVLEGMEWSSLILLSDADEIPSKEFIFQREGRVSPVKTPFLLSKQFFYYYNFKQRKKEQCHGTIGFFKCSLEDSKETFQNLRDKRFTLPAMKDAGWHLSFFGSPQHIKNKIESFAHTEFGSHNDLKVIEDNIKNSKDIFNRTGSEELVIIENNMEVPNYVLDNEKYKHLF